MSDYRIWFKVDGYSEIELPVNPQEVSISYPANPTNYDVEGVGDIIVPRIPKLATMSFESFFPREQVYLSVINSDSWYRPDWYVSFFRQLQMSRKPFELTIVRGYDRIREYDEYGNSYLNRTDYYDTVMKAVLLDITVTDKGGEPGDIYYNMTISEYRDATPKRLAELAEETKDDNGAIIEQKRVMVVNRPQQSGAIVVNSTVEVSGEVYEKPDSSKQDWDKSKVKANQIIRTVSRVLPAVVSNIMHGIYIPNVGWIDKGNCRIPNINGIIDRFS